MPTHSIILPTYNERDNIAFIVCLIVRTLSKAYAPDTGPGYLKPLPLSHPRTLSSLLEFPHPPTTLGPQHRRTSAETQARPLGKGLSPRLVVAWADARGRRSQVSEVVWVPQHGWCVAWVRVGSSGVVPLSTERK
jgi:hypothetical protein